MNYYYADAQRKPVGPLTQEQILALYERKVIQSTTSVIAEGSPAWSTFEAVFPDFGRPEGIEKTEATPPLPSANEIPARRGVSREAGALLNKVREETSEFDSTTKCKLPEFKYGTLFGQHGIAFFRLVRSKTIASLRGEMLLYVRHCYGKSEGIAICYNTAHAEGGRELDLTRINSEHDESLTYEHIGIKIPDDLLLNLEGGQGLRIRVSRPDEGKEFIIPIAAAHLEAAQVLLNPEAFDRALAPASGASGTGNKDSSKRPGSSPTTSEQGNTVAKWLGLAFLGLATVSAITFLWPRTSETNSVATKTMAANPAPGPSVQTEHPAPPKVAPVTASQVESKSSMEEAKGDLAKLVSSQQAAVFQMIKAELASDELALENAKGQLEALPKAEPGDRTIARDKNNEGLALLKDGDVQGAIYAFSLGTKADYTDVEVMNNLAWALMKANRQQEAWAVLMLTLQYDPTRTSAWANLGTLASEFDQAEIAEGSFLLAYRNSKNRARTRSYFEKQVAEAVNEKEAAVLQRVLARIPSG